MDEAYLLFHLPPPDCPKSSRDPLTTLAAQVSAKLEEGDFRGAVRLACSEDSLTDLDEETLAALRSKFSISLSMTAST